LCGHADVVARLIQNGANINYQDRSMGFTPLLWACSNGHLEVAHMLINAGVDINLPSRDFRLSPLIVAAINGHTDIVKLLIESGADIHAQTADGENALTRAQTNKHHDIVKMLRSHGVKKPAPLEEKYIQWPDVGEDLAKVDYTKPESVLRGFILSMYRWEKYAYEMWENSSEEIRPKIHERIRAEEIHAFQPYCTEKKRVYGRCGSFGSIPENTPEESLMSITHRTSSRVEIMTRQDNKRPGRHENIYILLKKKGHWLIDCKKHRPMGLTIWERAIL
jgi:hypothetical protein